jgi:hypothetical protein
MKIKVLRNEVENGKELGGSNFWIAGSAIESCPA